jgi:hypothetical protein
MISKQELVDSARATHLRMVMDENKKFRLQLKAVRELHKEVDANDSVCGDPDCCGEYDPDWVMCAECQSDYPCPTIQALDGEQGG